MTDVRDEIYGILADQFAIAREEIADSLEPGDLPGWNSLGHLRLVRRIEKHFGIRFSADEVMSFDDVGDLIALVGGLVSGAGGGAP